MDNMDTKINYAYEEAKQANRDIQIEIGGLMLSLEPGTKVERFGEWQITARNGNVVRMPSLLDALRTFKGLGN